MLELSRTDAETMRGCLQKAIRNTPSKSSTCSHTNWQRITELIADQHKPRMLEVADALAKVEISKLSFKAAELASRVLTHQAIVNYWEYPVADEPTISRRSLEAGMRRCRKAYTGHIKMSRLMTLSCL